MCSVLCSGGSGADGRVVWWWCDIGPVMVWYGDGGSVVVMVWV